LRNIGDKNAGLVLVPWNGGYFGARIQSAGVMLRSWFARLARRISWPAGCMCQAHLEMFTYCAKGRESIEDPSHTFDVIVLSCKAYDLNLRWSQSLRLSALTVSFCVTQRCSTFGILTRLITIGRERVLVVLPR